MIDLLAKKILFFCYPMVNPSPLSDNHRGPPYVDHLLESYRAGLVFGHWPLDCFWPVWLLLRFIHVYVSFHSVSQDSKGRLQPSPKWRPCTPSVVVVHGSGGPRGPSGHRDPGPLWRRSPGPWLVDDRAPPPALPYLWSCFFFFQVVRTVIWRPSWHHRTLSFLKNHTFASSQDIFSSDK